MSEIIEKIFEFSVKNKNFKLKKKLISSRKLF